MNLTPFQTLRALGVTPLRLRARIAPVTPVEESRNASVAGVADAFDHRIVFLRSREEIEQPALAALYTRITEAVSALGLQCVRIADAQGDVRVRVLAFGDVELPDAINPTRVLRVAALSILHADRARKRALWDVLRGFARKSESA